MIGLTYHAIYFVLDRQPQAALFLAQQNLSQSTIHSFAIHALPVTTTATESKSCNQSMNERGFFVIIVSQLSLLLSVVQSCCCFWRLHRNSYFIPTMGEPQHRVRLSYVRNFEALSGIHLWQSVGDQYQCVRIYL